jgi:hypothetical protein
MFALTALSEPIRPGRQTSQTVAPNRWREAPNGEDWRPLAPHKGAVGGGPLTTPLSHSPQARTAGRVLQVGTLTSAPASVNGCRLRGASNLRARIPRAPCPGARRSGTGASLYGVRPNRGTAAVESPAGGGRPAYHPSGGVRGGDGDSRSGPGPDRAPSARARRNRRPTPKKSTLPSPVRSHRASILMFVGSDLRASAPPGRFPCAGSQRATFGASPGTAPDILVGSPELRRSRGLNSAAPSQR